MDSYLKQRWIFPYFWCLLDLPEIRTDSVELQISTGEQLIDVNICSAGELLIDGSCILDSDVNICSAGSANHDIHDNLR